MGLQEKKGSNITFLTIARNSLCQRLDTDTPTQEDEFEVTLDKDKETERKIREKRFSTVSGLITGANIYVGDYGNALNIELEDDGEKYVVAVPFGDKRIDGNRFLRRLPNIDITKTFLFGVGKDKETKNCYYFARQDGENIPYYFTNDDPKGMPAPKARKGGKDDYKDQEEFLYGQAEIFIEKNGFSVPEKAQEAEVA